jgi:ribose transport system permease protein
VAARTGEAVTPRIKSIGFKTLITLGVPALVFLLFKGICAAAGHPGFGGGPDVRLLLYDTIYGGLIALAVSYNLTSGRLDFSVGSVLILSAVVGGNLAEKWGGGPVAMLLLMVVTGCVLGAISGVAYAWLRLPAMVVSLGVAMIYEAVAFWLSRGQGIRLVGRNDLLIFAKPPYSVILMLCVLAVLVYLLNFAKFGYNTNSLRTGQKIAVDVGVNEKRNAVACYVVAGALMACAAAVYFSKSGIVRPVTGLASSAFLLSAFLPMFIGIAMAKYSDRNIGIMVGAFIQAVIGLSFIRLGFSNSVQSVLNGVVVLLFLVYASNFYKIALRRLHKEKKQLALQQRSDVG